MSLPIVEFVLWVHEVYRYDLVPMKLIYITGGKVAKVDDLDFDSLNSRKWFLSRGYATSCEGPVKKMKMHQVILGKRYGFEIDHIDGDRMNNCRDNLRFGTHAKNMRNLPPRKWLKFKGVGINGTGWSARIRWSGGNAFHLGTFSTEEAAARAYDRKAHQLDPEFARLNFNDGIWSEEKLLEFRIGKKASHSGIRGVYASPSGWIARKTVGGKLVYIGTFETKEEAAEARAEFLQTYPA